MPLPSRPRRGRHRYRSLLSVLGICATALTAAPATAPAAPAGPSRPAGAPAKIDPAVLARMDAAEARGDGRVEAAVVLRTAADSLPDGTATEVRRALARGTAADQAPVVDLVEANGDRVLNTFWLKNMVLVRATPDTLRQLAALAPVERVIPNFTLESPPGETPEKSAAAVARATAGATTWGLAKIGADKAQDDRKLTGAGVRVAVLDTGIDIAHPDLSGKLAGADSADPAHPGGWIEFDADGRPVPGSLPHDSAYHGTHVAGTVAGGDASGTRIGVAPGAELMGGLVIPGGRGSLAQVIAGMQWAIAPYAADGTPAGKPADVVSMSLGSDGYADELVEPARNIARAGAFPAFAIGNECLQGSAAPGNVFEAVSVGATDADDNVADFSCGEVAHKSNWSSPPAEWPDTYVVPDVSAPGVDVLSALPDGGYGTLDGTSMATPHVSGTVALMLQARPDLTVDEALAILTGTSRADGRYGALPNPRYGHGRIDAYAAVTEAALNSGVRGTVTDGRSGKPLAGVAVARTDTGRTVTTDAAGRFSLRLAPAATTSRCPASDTRTP
ncbi:S8 family serine peptidase [Streptomyces sp. I5]|uniref:S8 family serine peptidase n=1 Tax=Streptomyces sp. I5 TaxID=2759947 RepID=UPI0018EEC3F4|nr:S8 family serine peptidase [Streptomyces sp. I5]MBJ6636191.1 S8 family serine peptidase [Streptomyces sp. I5]